MLKTHFQAQSVAQVILSPVMHYENAGQLTVPNHLNLASSAKSVGRFFRLREPS
jgi:hypothetical protein